MTLLSKEIDMSRASERDRDNIRNRVPSGFRSLVIKSRPIIWPVFIHRFGGRGDGGRGDAPKRYATRIGKDTALCVLSAIQHMICSRVHLVAFFCSVFRLR